VSEKYTIVLVGVFKKRHWKNRSRLLSWKSVDGTCLCCFCLS